ncbi:hypothetical protein K6U06_08205 [Acidiferrimicrobium sp. IK]|uniref:MinD/ParA family ATP-binding protein n=1 Tax=Acidiferrimicrobium sp. IK TaxID=2871700 RepID=UPI0021CB23E8|nr:hypothetical protein [Acidiferrimicrobium sp. IK]MCU4184341.1 hypothetical protein [Acidiferrimicrobium sp. IK]
MGLVTVTVAGELGELTVRVDADSPIGAHLGSWAKQCSTLDAGEAALVDLATSAVIGPDDTLASHRIGYGSRLRLVASRQPLTAAPPPRASADSTPATLAPPPVPVTVEVDASTPPVTVEAQEAEAPPTVPPAPGTTAAGLGAPAATAAGLGAPAATETAAELEAALGTAPAATSPAPAPPASRAASAAGAAEAARAASSSDGPGSAWPGAPRPSGGHDPAFAAPPAAGGLRRRMHAARAAMRRPAAPTTEAFALPEKQTAIRRWRTAMEETDRIRQLESVVRTAPLARTSVIAVVSPKGGVGKSTITALMGTLLAELRTDPVICVDANPDFGNLADKLSPPSANRGARTDELQAYLAQRGQVTPAELNQHLGIGPHGVRFVASPTGDPDRMIAAADLGLYQDLIRRLQAYAGIILLDCGTGFLDPPVRAALGAATEIVLVTDSSADTARLVVGAAGYLPPATPVWLAANKMPRRGSRVDLDAVRAALAVRDVVVIPERPLAENVVGPQFDWESAPPVWREPVRELLASLASAWPDLGAVTPGR